MRNQNQPKYIDMSYLNYTKGVFSNTLLNIVSVNREKVSSYGGLAVRTTECAH